MNEYQEALIKNIHNKSTKGLRHRLQECQVKVRCLRNKNDILQKQLQNVLQGDVKITVKQRNIDLEKEVNQIKRILTVFKNDFTDLSSRMKIRDLWIFTQKQINRCRILLEQLIKKAALSSSLIRNQLEISNKRNSKTQIQQNSNSIASIHQQGVSLAESQQFNEGTLLQKRIINEKQQLIRSVIESNNRICMNFQYNDSIISQKYNQTSQHKINHKTIILSKQNGELYELMKQQRKFKKKNIIVVVSITLFILILSGTLIYIFAY